MIPKWLAIGAGVLLLANLVWANFERAGRKEAEGRANTTDAKLVTCEQGREVEKSSARTAVDALDHVKQDRAEGVQRCASALAAKEGEAERYRAALARCASPEAVADRMGELFP